MRHFTVMFFVCTLGLMAMSSSKNKTVDSVSQWKVQPVKESQPLQAVHSATQQKIELRESGGPVQLKEWKPSPKNPHIGVLTYDSGQAGTRSVYRIIRAVIIDKRTNKTLVDAPVAYEATGKAPALPQPEWKWTDRSLTIKDDAFGEDLQLKF